jgi:hypothetical protein
MREGRRADASAHCATRSNSLSRLCTQEKAIHSRGFAAASFTPFPFASSSPCRARFLARSATMSWLGRAVSFGRFGSRLGTDRGLYVRERLLAGA